MKIRFLPRPPTSEVPFAIGVPALIWQFLFFYIPLLLIVVSSFLKFSLSGEIEGLTLEKILPFFSPLYLRVIGNSLLLALGNAILCLLIGYPFAYFLAFRGKRFKSLFLFLLIVPFWTNFLLHVYAWFFVLEKQGFLNILLTNLGIIDEPLHMLNSLFAIMVMMVYYYLPFMILPLYSTLERFNYKLIEASYDLGGSWLQTFRHIILPLSLRGMRAGFFLVFIPSFGEFAIPELMGGDKLMFVGSVVSHYILGEDTGELGAAFTVVASLFLIISAALLYFLINRLFGSRRAHA
ncbi:MAG: ABC transporter permease [Chlamydiales bacterium]|nr:ABC transporter permease [Chlamydiales bacterium]